VANLTEPLAKKQEFNMTFKSKLVLSVSALLFLVAPVFAALAMNAAECEALFEKADTDKDGALAQMEDPKWEQRISHMSTITKKDQGIVTKDQFMQSCKMGEMDGL
jgi:hypothetical protein